VPDAATGVAAQTLAPVGERRVDPLRQTDLSVDASQQQRAKVGRQAAGGESRSLPSYQSLTAFLPFFMQNSG